MDDFELMLVEDSDLDFEKVQRAFRRLKINKRLVRARHGEEALEIIRSGDYRNGSARQPVVLLDLNLPRMNGFEFLEELRNDDTLCHLPVFVLTTSTDKVEIRKAFKYNVCGYLVKPSSLEEMTDLLRITNDYWNICMMPA